jgi:uncharacterized protein (TIGR03435 family)
MRSLVPILVVAAIASASAQTPSSGPAQSPGAAAPAFEVASVKRNTSGPTGPMGLQAPPGRFTATNIPLRVLINISHQLSPFQFVGIPGWVDTERYDIAAKAPDGATEDQTLAMLRTLLAERFKFVAHTETKEAPISALVLARSDGKLGPKLVPSTVECAQIIKERQAAAVAARGRGRGGPPPAAPMGPLAPGEKPVCSIRMSPTPVPGGGMVMNYVAGAMGLDSLTRMLSSMVGRPVVDRTGLKGLFDYEFQFSPTRPPTTPPAAAAPGVAVPIAPLDEGLSVADGLRELGLKLESQRGPVEYLVIDNIERPVDD